MNEQLVVTRAVTPRPTMLKEAPQLMNGPGLLAVLSPFQTIPCTSIQQSVQLMKQQAKVTENLPNKGCGHKNTKYRHVYHMTIIR